MAVSSECMIVTDVNDSRLVRLFGLFQRYWGRKIDNFIEKDLSSARRGVSLRRSDYRLTSGPATRRHESRDVDGHGLGRSEGETIPFVVFFLVDLLFPGNIRV